MKPVFAALVIIALASPATSQGNSAPHGGPAAEVPAAPALSALAQQAYDSCPALMARTESAVQNGHEQYYYTYDCECIAQSIDYNTWDDASASYSGPRMPEADAYLILGAISGAPTIEDAFSQINSGVSATGYSATSACYAK